MGIKRIILTILICLLLSPLNVFAITYGKTGADTNFNGDINVPSGFNYYINGVVLNLGEANTASNIGANVEIFKQKTGVDLEFRTLKADSNKITISITDAGSKVVDATYATTTATYNVFGANYTSGQSWTAPSGYALGKIKVQISKAGSPSGNAICTLYAASGDSPTGDALSTGSVVASTIATDPGTFVEFTMSAYTIINATKYVFVITCPDGTSGNQLWAERADEANYADGMMGYTVGSAYETTASYDMSFEVWSGAGNLDYIKIDVVESEIRLDALKAAEDNTDLNASTTKHGLMPKLPFSGDLLSTTTVSFAVDGDTTLYTVPTGKRCVLHSAIIVAAGDAGATTTVSIGKDTAETDFVPANTLSNLDAQYDAVILMPIPNTTPLAIKSYAAATVIQAQVATQSGAAGNTIYLFGILY